MKLIESELKKLMDQNILVFDSTEGGVISERLCDLVYSVYYNRSKKKTKIIRAYVDSEDFVRYKYNGKPLVDIEFTVISGLTEVFKKLGGSTVGAYSFNPNYCENKIVVFEMENGDMMFGGY